jgi:hypothetical protein
MSIHIHSEGHPMAPRHHSIIAILSSLAGAAHACEFCSVASVTDARSTQPGWFAGLDQRFTHFGTLRDDGDEVDNDLDQRLDSALIQLVVGYRFDRIWGLQAVAPYVHRSFRRAEGFAVDSGTESGFGDLSLVGTATVWESTHEQVTGILTLLAGVKAPTGDSGRLIEEENEIVIPGAPESGVHGHDLARGSGSWDGLVGVTAFARWRRLFMTADAQYAIRTEGDHHYRYADDLTWRWSTGVLAWIDDRGTAGIQASLSGEAKGRDEHDGEKAEDTGIVAVYLGPLASCTWRDALSAEAGVDLPLLQDNTSLQIVPDYRIHAAVTGRF